MKTVVVLVMCAVLLASAGVRADSVLFKDTFNASVETNAISYDYTSRQSGGSIVVPYTEDSRTSGGTDDGMTKISNWSGSESSRCLNVASGSTWSGNICNWASPNYNFGDRSRYEVSLKVKTRVTQGSQADKYAGILLGSDSTTQFIDASDSGVAFIFTGNVTAASQGEPTWKVLDKGLVIASGYSNLNAAAFQPVSIYVDNSGSSALLDMWFAGEHILSRHAYSGGRFTNNWLTLGSFDGRTTSSNYTWGEFDDLTVTARNSIGSGGTGLAGFVDLEGYVGDVSMIAVRVEFIQGANVVRSETLLLDRFGYYSIAGLAAGTYDVAFKVSHSLKKVVTGVTVPGQCDVVLTNGDTDGDNQITTTDLSIELKQ